MLRRCLSLVLVASLVLSGRHAWAAATFVNVSARRTAIFKPGPPASPTAESRMMEGMQTNGYYYEPIFIPAAPTGP